MPNSTCVLGEPSEKESLQRLSLKICRGDSQTFSKWSQVEDDGNSRQGNSRTKAQRHKRRCQINRKPTDYQGEEVVKVILCPLLTPTVSLSTGDYRSEQFSWLTHRQGYHLSKIEISQGTLQYSQIHSQLLSPCHRLPRWIPFSKSNIGSREVNELQSPKIWV